MSFTKYIVSAFKNLGAKGHRNGLKILSLSMGLAVSLVLTSKVCLEQTYDDCYDDADCVCYISEFVPNMDGQDVVFPQTSGATAILMAQHYPQVEVGTRSVYLDSDLSIYADGDTERRQVESVVLADSSFFKVLTRPCLAGNITSSLGVQNNIVVSYSVAKMFYKGSSSEKHAIAADMVGRHIQMAGRKDMSFNVSGVFDDFPLNCSSRPDILVAMPTIAQLKGYDGSMNELGNDAYRSYVKLTDKSQIDVVNSQMSSFVNAYLPVEEFKAHGQECISYILRPYTDYHYDNDTGARSLTIILAFVAFALLLTSVLNYLLNVVSSSMTRSREMALRKCLGCGKSDIYGMMFAESIVHVVISLLVAIIIIFLCQGVVEEITGAPIEVLFSGRPLMLALCTVVFVLLINGVVPSEVFNRIGVMTVFRNVKSNKRAWKLGLLSVEFISVSFIAAVLIIVGLQYNKMTTADMGFEYENTVQVSIGEASYSERGALLSELKKQPGVSNVCMTYQNPFDWYSGNNVREAGSEKELFNVKDAYYVDENYLDLFGLKLLQGSNFTVGRNADEEIIVDKLFADRMKSLLGWDDVVGREVVVTSHANDRPMTIVGVVDNFKTGSFATSSDFMENRPMIILYCDPAQNMGWFHNIFVKYNSLVPGTIAQIQSVIEKTAPGLSAPTVALKDYAISLYVDTLNTRNAIFIGGIITLLIAILGLVSYTIDEVKLRQKEIAVRRVNGAQISQIRQMYVVDVLKVTIPSVIIGCILSAFVSLRWQEQFTLQVGLPWWVFVVAFTLTIAVVSIINVLYVSKYANENPANSLKVN